MTISDGFLLKEFRIFWFQRLPRACGAGKDASNETVGNGLFLLVTDIFNFDQQFGFSCNAENRIRWKPGRAYTVKTAHKGFKALSFLVNLQVRQFVSNKERVNALLTRAPIERSKKSKNWKSGGVLY